MLKWGIFLCALFFFLLFIRNTDVRKIMAELQQVGLRFFVLILVTFIAYFWGVLGWRFCMGKSGAQISVARLFAVRHVSETIGILNPAGVVGVEAMKVYLLRSYGIPTSKLLSSIVLSRVIMVVSQLILFVLITLLCWHKGLRSFLPVKTGVWSSSSLVYAVCILTVILFFVFLFKSSYRTNTDNFIGRQIRTVRDRSAAIRKEMQHVLFRKKQMAYSFLSFVLHWIFGAFEFYMILRLLKVDVSIGEGMLVDLGVMFFKAAGFFVPGQLGIEEYGNKIMLSAIGIHDESVWLTASVLRRARQICWILLAALLYFVLLHTRKHSTRPDGGIIYKP